MGEAGFWHTAGMGDDAVRLLLVRHGQVDANLEYRFLGRRDDPLNATGERQAELLAELFTEVHVDAVLASPLARTRRTAEAIARAAGVGVVAEERLIELDFGDWDGLSRDEVTARDPQGMQVLREWDGDPTLAAPGGESLGAVQARVVDLAEELARRRPGETVVAVTHMGPIKALLCAALGVDLGVSRRLFLDPATISVVDWSRRPLVRLFNSHAHLGWMNARWLRPRSR